MTHAELTACLNDLAVLMTKVRSLKPDHPLEQSAALNSLSAAVYHLQRMKNQSSGSLPPSDNRAVRDTASQMFRNTREILKGVR